MNALVGFAVGAVCGGGVGFIAALFYGNMDSFAAMTWPVGGAFVGAALGVVVAG